MMSFLQDFLTYFSGYITIVIAITMVYIAIQQLLIARYRVRMDLYDKRIKVYNSVMEFLGRILGRGNATDDNLFDLINQTKESRFLFEGEIGDQIEVLRKQAIKLQYFNCQLSDDRLPVAERNKLADELQKGFHWFHQQYDYTEELFLKYLKIAKRL